MEILQTIATLWFIGWLFTVAWGILNNKEIALMVQSWNDLDIGFWVTVLILIPSWPLILFCWLFIDENYPG